MKGRKPWKRETLPADQLVAERLEQIREGKEENQQQMAEAAAHHTH